MGVETKGKNPSSHCPPQAHCPCWASLGSAMGVGVGRPLHSQTRENCANDVQPLVSFKKEAPAGIGASRAIGSTARLVHVRLCTAADLQCISCRAWVHWQPPARNPRGSSGPLPTPHPPSFPFPSTSPPPPSPSKGSSEAAGQGIKRDSKWAGLRERGALSPPSSLLKSPAGDSLESGRPEF